MRKGLVLIHLGAGNHSQSNKKKYVRSSRKALEIGKQLLKCNKSCEEIAVEVCKSLETSSCTNAGYGSEITSGKTVEMDATIASSDRFASVGAVRCLRNPCILANSLYCAMRDEAEDQFGRSSPHMLVGSGATEFAKKLGYKICEETELMAPEPLKRYNCWKKAYDSFDFNSEKPEFSDLETNSVDMQDTVGVICIDHQGRMCAISSSGGTTFKTPGRIGPAAIYGAGTYVENDMVVTCTTGYGEDIIQFDLARRASFDLMTSNTESHLETLRQLVEKLENKPRQSKTLSIGIVSVIQSNEFTTICICHTTPSMIVGYITDDNEHEIFISRRDRSESRFTGMETRVYLQNSVFTGK